MTNYFLKLFKIKKHHKERGAITITISTGILLIGAAITAVLAAGGGVALYHGISKETADFVAGLFFWAGDLIYWTTNLLASLSSDLYDVILKSIGEKQITKNDQFLKGWSIVRDFSNMFIVLGFVIIGIATILRIREYEAKKLLLPLIIVALLINFSGLVCGVIIDASNIAFKGILADGALTNQAKHYLTMVERSANIIRKTNDNSQYLKSSLLFSFYFLAIAITFYYLSFVFILRQAMLTFLFVFSPLAFVCRAFPFKKAQEIWNMWWENLIKWAFVAIGAALILRVSAGMLGKISYKLVETQPGYVEQIPQIDASNLMIVFLFYIIGFKLVTKSSAMGAGFVMGLAGKTLGIAMGAGAGLAKGGGKGLFAGADKLSSGKLSSATQTVRGGVGRAMERMSWATGRKPGTTAINENARVAEEKKRVEALYNSGNSADEAEANKILRKGHGPQKVGALAAAISSNKLSSAYKNPTTGALDTAALDRDLNYSKQFGAGDLRKDATKQAPVLAATDWPTISKLKEQHPSWTTSEAQHESVVRAVGKIPEDDLNKDLADALSPAQIRDAGLRMTNRRRQTFQRNAYEAMRQQRRSMPFATPAERSKKAEILRKERELRNLF
ncbi:MAG: hypothetical protein WCY28_03160 [Candidatus Shapirobacteria bacterium]|jgi:hypothetical protein